MSLEEAMNNAPRLLSAAAGNVVRLVRAMRGTPIMLNYADSGYGPKLPPAGPVARVFYRLCYRLGRGVRILSGR
jgi:hypothetical protein